MNEIILNSEQQKVVKSESKRVFCVAGAGSGKSRCLVERIAYLIEEKNVSPYEILAQTFTRLASKELVERLEKRIGKDSYKITCGTIHAVSLNFIQRFGELIGLTPHKITVYNQWESDYLLKEVAKDLGYHNRYKWIKVRIKDVKIVMDDFYNGKIDAMLLSDDESILDKYSCYYGECIDIVQAFQARCKENNALTYDSILYQFHKLLPKIKEYLGFKHIFVDEVQDNSQIQWDITESMVSLCDASLFVLGDLNQSIYQFRGAAPEYILNNQASFDILKLQKNYRSDANIVEAANRLIKHNTQTIELEMVPVKEKNIKIDWQREVNSKTLASAITDLFEKKTLDGMAVLARNHFMLEKLSKLLEEAGIKHDYIGKQSKLVHGEDFIRFTAFLKLIVNPNDNFAFLLIKDILSLSQEDYANIRVEASKRGEDHYTAWKTDFNRFYGHGWESWFKSSDKGDMDTVIDWLKFVDFGFDIDQMLDFIYLWRLDNLNKDIEDYLNWLTVFDIQDEIKKDSKGLMLSTIHGVKGLEFDTVIIAGLNETILPSKQAIKKNAIDDERNLAYVAMTRAESQLILTSRPIEKDLFEIKNAASRFVAEAMI